MIDLVFVDAFVYVFEQPIFVYLITGVPTFIAIAISLLLTLKKWGEYP